MQTVSRTLSSAVLALSVVLVPACGQSVTERAANDQVAFVNTGDAAMDRAFEKANATLDEFFQLAKSPRDGTEGYAIKVAVSDGENTEYFWVNDFEMDGEELSGVLSNEPETVKTYKMGERITFARSKVVDWMYLEPAERRMHGNFTACALLTHEEPAEAEEFKKQYGLQCD